MTIESTGTDGSTRSTEPAAEEEPLARRQQAWVDAEIAGDTTALADLCRDDFVLVGPLGFVLDREQWLSRYASGDLVTTSLVWVDPQVREIGEVALVIGIHDQRGSYRGRANDARFRVTQIWTRASGRWLLAGQHLSTLAAPPTAAATAAAATATGPAS